MVLSVKNWTYYGLPTDERTCKVRFTYVLIPTGYVRVVKFLEKVIIERNADLKRPFKCKEVQKPSFVTRVTSVGKIFPFRIPLG